MSYTAISPFQTAKTSRFNKIRITMASPETIRSWSNGEVKKAETINYRTLRAEKDGLFCERIFGPTRDWECFCGKYKRVKNKGVICDRCGVEVTLAKVRRERMGHIELEVPVAHIWYVKGTPSRVATLLNISTRDLERVLYYESYIVTDPGSTPLVYKQLLTEEQYQKARAAFGYDFEADMGAGVVRDMLTAIDLEDLVTDLRTELEAATSKQARHSILKRLAIAEAFRKSGNRPEWMILEVIPVIPPELRPLVPLDGGRFATSDLNDLYRSVIHRNNRLRRLKELSAPAVILRNEKRMLQEAVDALFDNGRRGRAVRGSGNRPLKSLSHTVKGKMGRFRQNLLGKRVDYSGRSVIVVGPELKLHQCGIPKRMALELFRPFVIMRLEQAGIVHTVKSARKLLDQVSPEVWDILEEIIQDHPVMLNRAPTLHRLGIQAFQPVLVEGEAIRIHPLVCTAFNADFDGDQMAVHVPLSVEAQLESRLLMLSTHNILSPANGSALATPTKDMVLGVYYMTKPRLERTPPEKCRRFLTLDEVKLGYDLGMLDLHEDVLVRRDPDWLVDTGDLFRERWVYTTVGIVLFNQLLPRQMRWESRLMKKEAITKIVGDCYKRYGEDLTVELLDNLKWAGFRFATQSGLTVGVDDMVIPEEKPSIINRTMGTVKRVAKSYKKGEISNGERYNMVIDAWTDATDNVADRMIHNLSLDQEGYNSIYMMADSGARGSRQQIRQLAGMRGLMAKPQKKVTGSIGEIIEEPILANFRDGLSVLEYFISTHGARKGLADTALKTADAGYLTRRLVDVAQDTIVTMHDCETIRGIDIEALHEGDEIIEPLADRILGRVALDDIYHPATNEVLVHAGELVNEEKALLIEESGIDRVKIRSVLTCEAEHGVCALCYGANLATGELVDIGEAVGVIAAQSIGEPGTQLTLRTFHIGGTASRIIQQTHAEAKRQGRIELHNLDTITNRENQMLANSRNGHIVLYDDEGNELIKYDVPYGAEVRVEHDQRVRRGDVILAWEPYTSPILTTIDGRVEFIDIVEGITVAEELDESSERIQRVITEYKDKKLHPQILVHGANNTEEVYSVPIGAYLLTHHTEEVKAGDVLAKIPLEWGKTSDITGGLPRVVELLEARKPKNPATISEIDGRVAFGQPKKGKRSIKVTNEVEEREYLVPFGKHVIVFEGDDIQAGDPLTEGDINPHDLLAVKGSTIVQEYLVNQIQEVYRLQGVSINDKHMEVIVRKMLRRVQIHDIGDTRFLPGELVDRHAYRDENRAVIEEGGRPATAQPVLQGITKASLSTVSFLSASSFQDTTRVLAEAAVSGKRDFLRGLKENVLVGRLIPAGTGLHSEEIYDVALEPGFHAPQAQEEEAEKVSAGSALQFEEFDGTTEAEDVEAEEEDEPEPVEEELEERE
jgi:DNA-directed RNA polymerase subunit beta'